MAAELAEEFLASRAGANQLTAPSSWPADIQLNYIGYSRRATSEQDRANVASLIINRTTPPPLHIGMLLLLLSQLVLMQFLRTTEHNGIMSPVSAPVKYFNRDPEWQELLYSYTSAN